MDPASFRDDLFRAGVLTPTGVDGLYGRSGDYERVAAALGTLASGLVEDETFTALRFPPIVPRPVLEGAGYHKSFPDLMGSVHVFDGDDRRHGELVQLADAGGDWEALFAPSEVALGSAACHPVYPLCSGTVPAGGRRFDVASYCFRHEPSVDPVRMQAFVMHELVFVGGAEEALAHREQYLALALKALDELGLSTDTVVANDPFFGRRGRIIAAAQREEALKIEVVVPVSSDSSPTAVVSGNCHRDHFGSAFAIRVEDGTVAHSACVAFGVDRLVLALFRHHGLELTGWPAAVTNRLFK